MGATRRASLLVLLLVAAAPVVAGLRIEVDAEGLTDAERRETRALLARVETLLPARFAEALDATIPMRWRDDLPKAVHGRAQRGGIGLQRSLLHAWTARDRAAGDGDPAARAALAALLHELAHVHDRSPRGGVSRDPRLLDLAGWPVQPLRLGRRVARNDLKDRSPDAYELASPAEFVAVNFEHFLLDPAYACARPALHRHLVSIYGPPPGRAREPDCAAGMPFVAAAGSGAMVRALDLDPARVQSVDYLFAEASGQPMSRWGHAMLRLVVCAPGRERGPGCRLDLQHHVVLSFRAFVDDVQVSSWRGLTGSYPARLFVLPLEQVVDEYTRVELRGLQSIPLRLGDAEIRDLIERAARVHWSYDGRYRFVGNNCAVETWKLLNDAVPRLAAKQLRSVTPTGLLRRLVREDVADASVLGDAAAALRDGYRFASLAEHFDAMHAIAASELALPAKDALAWFALDPAIRAPWLERGGLRSSAALLVLEQAALRREQAAVRELLKQRMLRGRVPDPELARDSLRRLLADGAWAGRPAQLLGGGYGIPQSAERSRLAEAVARDDTRLRGLRDDLHLRLRDWLPAAQAARLALTEANVDRIGRHLRAMTTGPGGAG